MENKTKTIALIFTLYTALFAGYELWGPVSVVGDSAEAAVLRLGHTPAAALQPDSILVKLPDSTIGTYPLSAAMSDSVPWDFITDKPDSFQSKNHNHPISDVNNLIDSLNKKYNTADTNKLQQKITGAATTVTSNNLTVSSVLISNSSGKIAVSPVKSTELGYLDGVTSNIQTQIGSKSDTSHNHALSDVTGLNGALSGKEPTITGSTEGKFWNGLKQWVNITIGNVLGLNDTITNHRTAIASKLNISDTSSLARKNHEHSQSQITGLVDTVTAHRNAINNKQPLDTDLTTIAGLTHSNRHVMVSNGSSWTRRALAEDDLPSLSISKITNLQTALDDKQSTIPYGTTGIEFYAWDKTMKAVDWTYVANKPSYFAPSTHNHPWSEITGKPSTFAPAAHGLVSSTHTVSGLTAGHVLKALSATTYGFAALTPSEIGAPAIGTERSLSVTTAGWVTIATCATGRAYGEFHVYDPTSGKHNFTKIIASTSYGENSVSVIEGNRFSTRSIAHVRVLKNSSDPIYGGAKLQVYCENPPFTLYVKQFLSQEFTSWKSWNNVTPIAEGTPSGYVQDNSTYLQDITNPNHSFVGNVFSGKELLLSGSAEPTITMEGNVTTIAMKPYQYGGLSIGSTNSGHSIMRNSTAQTLLINRLYGGTAYPIVGFPVNNSGSYFFGPIVSSSQAGHYFYNDSDSKTTLICGGSSYDASNGPSIIMRGNTYSYEPEQGCIRLVPGATANGHISLEGNRVVMSRRNVGGAATINITTNPQIIDLNSYTGVSRFDIATSRTDDPRVYFKNATNGDELFVKIVSAGQYPSEYDVLFGWNLGSDGTWMHYGTKRYFHIICEGTATQGGITANIWWMMGAHGLYGP